MRLFPNIISCFRMLLSTLLLLLTDKPIIFICIYFLCGISDIADGYIARRFKMESKLGAKLDSLGDFIFFGVTLFLFTLLFWMNIKRDTFILTSFIIIVTLRLVNFIITSIRFKQLGMMHTIGNKITGCILFISLPICVLYNHLPYFIVMPLSVIGIFSSLEECVILITSKVYDVNKKSLFI